MQFLALFASLPARQSAGRMRIWRALRALGCATLRDGVYVLPDAPEHAASLGRMAEEVLAVQGTAEVFRLGARDDAQLTEMVSLFDRSDDYAALIDSVGRADPRDAKVLRGLRRELVRLATIDFYPGEAQRQAQAAMAALESASSGEPLTTRGKIQRLDHAKFQGRTWATRPRPWVDRMASAWLIRRFIDRKAKFVWLAKPNKAPKGALGFDFDGAAFTHVGGRVSFEVLLASFGLDGDPALMRVAAVVHFLDVGGISVTEAMGVEAVLAGLRDSVADDDKLLIEAGRVFDGLYRNFQMEKAHG